MSYNLQTAKRIATIAVRMYGEYSNEQENITQFGIWNDHPAVQAILAYMKEQEIDLDR